MYLSKFDKSLYAIDNAKTNDQGTSRPPGYPYDQPRHTSNSYTILAFDEYLLSTYSVPGSTLYAGIKMIHKTDVPSALLELHLIENTNSEQITPSAMRERIFV